MKYVFGLNYMYLYKLLVVKTTTEAGRYWVPLETVKTQQFISNHPRVGFVASVGIRTMSHISSLIIFLIIRNTCTFSGYWWCAVILNCVFGSAWFSPQMSSLSSCHP